MSNLCPNHEEYPNTFQLPPYGNDSKHTGTRQPLLQSINSSSSQHGSHTGEGNETELNNTHSYGSFFYFFLSTKGPPQVIFVCFMLSLSMGSTIGIVPDVATDQYARLYHGMSGKCSLYVEKPSACIRGSEDAQNASAYSSLVSNSLAFVTSSTVGSISDARGRKGLMILSVFMCLFPPLCLVWMQVYKSFNPALYYISNSFSNVISSTSLGFAMISDIMPHRLRAISFGLILGGFSVGFVFGPMLATFLSHVEASLFCLFAMFFLFLFVVFRLPETLPEGVARSSLHVHDQSNYTCHDKFLSALVRPWKDISILNREDLFRKLASLAFLSGIIGQADQSLLLYYLEEFLAFNDRDVAELLVLVGVFGIFAQLVLLKALNDCVGEQLILVIGFFAGFVQNLLYGLSREKYGVLIGAVFGSLSMLTFPTISAIKSNNVDEYEQGRIQGALYSVSALASAIGPVSLRFVYHISKQWRYPGAGTMFVFASILYSGAIPIAWSLPKDRTNSNEKHKAGGIEEGEASHGEGF